jgi:hypothetical protein
MKRKVLLFSFLFVLLAKVGETEYLTHLEYCHAPYAAGGHWANVSGDSFSYIGAMENYVSRGRYHFINEKGQEVRAGRPPHYAVPYFLLRQAFPPQTALDIFVFLQLFIESLAVICLALLAYYLTNKRWCFYAITGLAVISLYVTVWSYNTYTDALSSNLLVIAAFFYYKYLRSDAGKHLLYSSLLLGVITCFRPYLVLIYPILGIVELARNGWMLKKIAQRSLIIGLPLVMLLTPWVVRNYVVMDQIFLFQQDMYAGYGFAKDELAVRKALASMGEDGGAWWDRKSAASYFNQRSLSTSLYQYPSYIKTDEVLYRQLEALRKANLGPQKDAARIIQMAEGAKQYYKSTYPVRYYFSNHLNLVYRFLVHNGSYRLPVNQASSCYQPVQFGLKLGQSLLYYLSLVFGAIGLVMMGLKDRRNFIFLFPSVFLLLLFPVYFGLVEWRYFLPFYYFHLIGLVYLLHYFIETKAKKNASGTQVPGSFS